MCNINKRITCIALAASIVLLSGCSAIKDMKNLDGGARGEVVHAWDDARIEVPFVADENGLQRVSAYLNGEKTSLLVATTTSGEKLLPLEQTAKGLGFNVSIVDEFGNGKITSISVTGKGRSFTDVSKTYSVSGVTFVDTNTITNDLNCSVATEGENLYISTKEWSIYQRFSEWKTLIKDARIGAPIIISTYKSNLEIERNLKRIVQSITVAATISTGWGAALSAAAIASIQSIDPEELARVTYVAYSAQFYDEAFRYADELEKKITEIQREINRQNLDVSIYQTVLMTASDAKEVFDLYAGMVSWFKAAQAVIKPVEDYYNEKYWSKGQWGQAGTLMLTWAGIDSWTDFLTGDALDLFINTNTMKKALSLFKDRKTHIEMLQDIKTAVEVFTIGIDSNKNVSVSKSLFADTEATFKTAQRDLENDWVLSY
ncbi:MAG: hypothetical protein LBN02_05245 [Oscillospiraceae bacterium]|jgi:hypothetical protein|nr:hypothetical protein [Oscillospiraceae bacterium]